MRWVAPAEKDTANQTLEKRLWAAADQRIARTGWTRILGARATKQTFSPRYLVELSTAGPVSAPEVSRPRSRAAPHSFASSPRTQPRPRRASGGIGAFGQMKYVFQCPYCGKKFERKQHDAALNPHKTKDGYPCPSRVGHYVETKY